MLGERLHNAIKDAKIPISRVAGHIGISETSLYNIFKKDSFEDSYLKKAAEILQLPISYFLDDYAPTSQITQTGFGNISGTGNHQKIMPGADSTGHTTSSTNTPDLAAKLAQCEQENASLTRELDITRELVRAKDDMITLLRGSRDNPN